MAEEMKQKATRSHKKGSLNILVYTMSLKTFLFSSFQVLRILLLATNLRKLGELLRESCQCLQYN